MDDNARMISETINEGPTRTPHRLVVAAAAVLIAAVAVGLWFLIGGGGAGERATASDVQRVIRRYNVLLADGYRSLNMSAMREVAGQLQAEDEYVHMASLAEGGVRLDSQLKTLDFLKISVEATSATAETRERWDYRRYSRQTGDLVLEQKDLIYHLAWDLEQQPDGRWLVTDVRAISTTAAAEPSVVGTTSSGAHGQ